MIYISLYTLVGRGSFSRLNFFPFLSPVEVELDKYRTWCPKAGCETICLVGPTSVERLVTLQSTSSSIVQAPCAVHCPTCREDFCSGCKKTVSIFGFFKVTGDVNVFLDRQWHPTMTCEENTKQLQATGKNEVLGIPFDNDLIKCCPMCSVPIEKDEGCAQMMCKRCKHVFCWYCLASLDVSMPFLWSKLCNVM